MRNKEAVDYLNNLYNITQQAIKSGDWKVDGSCDPDMLLREIEKYLNEPDKFKEKPSTTDWVNMGGGK